MITGGVHFARASSPLAVGYTLYGKRFLNTACATELRNVFREADPEKGEPLKLRDRAI
jgi:hypothetical protein